jgi:hypothetical protein
MNMPYWKAALSSAALLLCSVAWALSPRPDPPETVGFHRYLGFPAGQLKLAEPERDSLGELVASLKRCGAHWAGGTTVTIGSYSKADPKRPTSRSTLARRAANVKAHLVTSGVDANNIYVRLIQDTDPDLSYYPDAYGSHTTDFVVLRTCCSSKDNSVVFNDRCRGERGRELFEPRRQRP